MEVRTRHVEFTAERAKRDAELAARKEAIRIIDAWNKRLLSGSAPLFSPTIRAGLLGGCRWLDVYCPGCKTVATVDLEKVDRHPRCFARLVRVVAEMPQLPRTASTISKADTQGNDWLRQRLDFAAEG